MDFIRYSLRDGHLKVDFSGVTEGGVFGEIGFEGICSEVFFVVLREILGEAWVSSLTSVSIASIGVRGLYTSLFEGVEALKSFEVDEPTS